MKIDEILRDAIAKEASDVHIVCVLPPLFRVNGILRKMENYGDITPDRSMDSTIAAQTSFTSSGFIGGMLSVNG